MPLSAEAGRQRAEGKGRAFPVLMGQEASVVKRAACGPEPRVLSEQTIRVQLFYEDFPPYFRLLHLSHVNSKILTKQRIERSKNKLLSLTRPDTTEIFLVSEIEL